MKDGCSSRPRGCPGVPVAPAPPPDPVGTIFVGIDICLDTALPAPAAPQTLCPLPPAAATVGGCTMRAFMPGARYSRGGCTPRSSGETPLVGLARTRVPGRSVGFTEGVSQRAAWTRRGGLCGAAEEDTGAGAVLLPEEEGPGAFCDKTHCELDWAIPPFASTEVAAAGA